MWSMVAIFFVDVTDVSRCCLKINNLYFILYFPFSFFAAHIIYNTQ